MRARFVCLVFLVFAVSLGAQTTGSLNPNPFAPIPQPTGPVERNTYGTTDAIVQTIGQWDFGVDSSATTFVWQNGGRWITSGTGWMNANVELPAGAAIFGVEMEVCDDSATGHAHGFLGFASVSTGGFATNLAPFDTGVVETPSCHYLFSPLASPHTVDNFNNNYYIEYFNTGATDGSVKLRAARVFYTLQISPTPATATFADVPVGHPLHQFVEALVAAGITAGCDASNFCPNANLTRGQMAVFLAKALGLHWTP